MTPTIAVVMPLAEQRGGGELMLRQLIDRRDGTDARWVVIFLEDGPMAREFAAAGVTTHVVEAGRLRQLGRYRAAVRQIADLLKRERCDLAVAWMTKAHLYAAPAAR